MFSKSGVYFTLTAHLHASGHMASTQKPPMATVMNSTCLEAGGTTFKSKSIIQRPEVLKYVSTYGCEISIPLILTSIIPNINLKNGSNTKITSNLKPCFLTALLLNLVY